MRKGDTIKYKGVPIYFNEYGEYCVLNEMLDLIDYNSSFKQLKMAKKYVENYLLAQEKLILI